MSKVLSHSITSDGHLAYFIKWSYNFIGIVLRHLACDCENISQSYILIKYLPGIFSATVAAVLLIYRNV